MDPDEYIALILDTLREHLTEMCHDASLNGDGWQVSGSDTHWDGCNATWQVVLLAPGGVQLAAGSSIKILKRSVPPDYRATMVAQQVSADMVNILATLVSMIGQRKASTNGKRKLVRSRL